MFKHHAPSIKRLTALVLIVCLVATVFIGCAKQPAAATPAAAAPVQKSITILYTNDAHCAVDGAIGYSGLAAYKKDLIAKGNEVLLVDCGDAVQGAPIGSFTEGKSIIDIMNYVGYDAMAIGNHEFDYGADRLAELAEQAKFPLLSLNFVNLKDNSPVYQPYIIKEIAGKQVALLGISTPRTITSSTPTYFMDNNRNFIYGFMQDDTGEALWAAVQATVDAARAEGADYVVALAHLGIDASTEPYISSNMIENTTGIDVVLDGHSHSVLPNELVKNKDGTDVLLSSTGTQLSSFGVLTIDGEGHAKTKLVSYCPLRDSDTTAFIQTCQSEYESVLNTVVANLPNDLIVKDPKTGERIIRVAETNLGDLCADAYRAAGDAEIGLSNGGGIRTNMEAGDVTFGEILAVFPFGNMLCKINATGQQVLDALEFGTKSLPAEFGGFLQVSGLTYEIHTYVPSSVTMDKDGMFTGVSGEYRVKNVMVGGEPLDLNKTYTLVSHNYMIKNCGDGYTMFVDCELLLDEFIIDNMALSNYITEQFATHAADYADPYGADRIIIKDKK